MKDFFHFVADNHKRPMLVWQLFRELYWSFTYILSAFFGFFYYPTIKHPKQAKNLPKSSDKNKANTKTSSQRPIVFIGGLLGRPIHFSKIAKQLAKNGHQIYYFHKTISIMPLSFYAKKLENFLVKEDISHAYIIAHSIGGLSALYMNYQGRDRIHKLITLSTPLWGSWMFLPFAFIPVFFYTLPISPFIRKLKKSYSSYLAIQSVFSTFDAFIIPSKNARLGRFDDIRIDELGHFNILYSKSTHLLITEIIATENKKELLSETISKTHSDLSAQEKREQKKTVKKTVKKRVTKRVKK